MNNFYDYCGRLANEFNLDYNTYFGHIYFFALLYFLDVC